MTPEEAARALGATLARSGITESALEIARTIARPLESEEHAIALPTISLGVRSASSSTSATDPRSDGETDLIAQGELGRGGMGIVHLAEQRSLGRDVAVKTVLAGGRSMARALVREARIMGSLEHPNLVPVHALGIDVTGAPILVMKRIEGVSWRALLVDPAHEGWRPLLAGHGDRLRANVEILSHVCRALAFAHDRGVVHRDLKPDNVMIGHFGEVYLLDWGVALRLSEREAEADSIVGTPGYLAPEMALADPALVDARTDVYLLGGVLYEVLSGRMPHDAPTPMSAIVAALSGKRAPLPESAPSELADLVRRAMATAPADRIVSAEAFREGLAHFLAACEVDRAVAEARVALSQARASIERDGPQSIDAFRALIEARFAFGSAHRGRPADAAVRQDLDACIVHLVQREIALRSPIGARTLLAELGAPAPQLASRVDALEREIAAEREAADALLEARRASDTSPGLRAMNALLAVAAMVVLPGLAWIAWEAEAGREMPVAWSMAIVISIPVVIVLGVFFGRRTVLASEASRRVSALVVVCASAYSLFPGVTFALGRTMNDAVPYTQAAYVCIWTMGAVAVVRELWPNAVVYLVGMIATLALPRWTAMIQVLVTALALLVLWRALRLHAERSRTATKAHGAAQAGS